MGKELEILHTWLERSVEALYRNRVDYHEKRLSYNHTHYLVEKYRIQPIMIGSDFKL